MDKHNDQLIKVAKAPNEPLALMWKEALERAGISAMVRATGGGLASYLGTEIPYDLYVLSEDEERAREILEEIMGDDEELA